MKYEEIEKWNKELQGLKIKPSSPHRTQKKGEIIDPIYNTVTKVLIGIVIFVAALIGIGGIYLLTVIIFPEKFA